MLMALVVSVKRESAHADLEPTSIEKLTGNNTEIQNLLNSTEIQRIVHSITLDYKEAKAFRREEIHNPGIQQVRKSSN